MKKLISGKVRDVYDVGENKLVIVATDRISAFDVILNCSTGHDENISLERLKKELGDRKTDRICSFTKPV